MMRNLARNKKRKEKQIPGAPAQELHPRPPKIRLNTKIRIATLNVRGLIIGGKRNEIETYMKHKDIDIMLRQETHIGDDIREI